MRTITLEEHFATPRFLDGPGRDLKEQAEKFNNARALKLIPQLCDLGDKRIAEMDAAGIDMQIVSLTAPGVEQLEAAEAIALARRYERLRRRRDEEASGPLRRLRGAADRGAGQGRARAGAPRTRAEIRRRGHQRPQPRPLSRRQILLADPGKRRTARRRRSTCIRRGRHSR